MHNTLDRNKSSSSFKSKPKAIKSSDSVTKTTYTNANIHKVLQKNHSLSYPTSKLYNITKKSKYTKSTKDQNIINKMIQHTFGIDPSSIFTAHLYLILSTIKYLQRFFFLKIVILLKALEYFKKLFVNSIEGK